MSIPADPDILELAKLRDELRDQLRSNEGLLERAICRHMKVPASLTGRIARRKKQIVALEAAINYYEHMEQGHSQPGLEDAQ